MGIDYRLIDNVLQNENERQSRRRNEDLAARELKHANWKRKQEINRTRARERRRRIRQSAETN